MFDLSQIGERLRTQHNRYTANPIFLVEEKKRIYGIGTQYDPQIAWLYEDESVEVPPEEAKALESRYDEDGDDSPEGYRRVGYHESWEYVQPFFTEAGAEHYIKINGHNHSGELRIYVGSAYRNHEWQAVRNFLLTDKVSVTSEPRK